MTRAAAARPPAARSGRRASPQSSGSSEHGLGGYLQRSERPLHSLALLLPLIAVYEIGWRSTTSRLVAFHLLNQFFAFFGAEVRFLPAGALIVILLCWHLARKDPWEIRVDTLIGMAVEGAMLALPLLALDAASAQWEVRIELRGPLAAWSDGAFTSIGAGLYEELVFRLIGLTALNLFLIDALKMPKGRSLLLMVVSSAVLFSFYHYLGAEPFGWRTFAFRTVAGIYFACLFLCRGFGVTAFCHVAYDVLVVALVARH